MFESYNWFFYKFNKAINYQNLHFFQVLIIYSALQYNYAKYLLTTESYPQNRAGIIHKNVFEWLLKN